MVTALRYHVPESINAQILDYNNSFSLRFTSGTATSAWHCLEKGIIIGCTIPVSLFALAMNMLVKSAEVECGGPLSSSGSHHPPMVPPRAEKALCMCTNEFQASQTQDWGSEEGKNVWQVPLLFRSSSNFISVWEACEEPGKDLQLHPETLQWSSQLVQCWKHGYQQWTSQDFHGSSRHGFTWKWRKIEIYSVIMDTKHVTMKLLCFVLSVRTTLAHHCGTDLYSDFGSTFVFAVEINKLQCFLFFFYFFPHNK